MKSLIPGGGDRRTCNIQKDNFLKSSRAVRPDGCSGAHSAQDDEHPTAVLAHPFSSTESSAFTRQRQKPAKVGFFFGAWARKDKKEIGAVGRRKAPQGALGHRRRAL
eukprot:scaffold116108_cov69-Phaeocystis_antarctica.AAC.2